MLVKDRQVGSKHTINASTVCAWYECISQPSEGLLDCPSSTKGCSVLFESVLILCVQRGICNIGRTLLCEIRQ